MTRDWESTFIEWSKPASNTEEEKCANTERMIRDAIDNHPLLAKRNMDVSTQGSYKNNTNVRLDSDVDICCLCNDVFFYELPADGTISKEQAGILDADYAYSTYKNDVESALVTKFGREMVTRGNKAFDVHASSYRVDADVVPCFEHRRYYRNSSNKIDYFSGVELRPDRGGRIINWPKQHYENGVQKNKETGGMFKKATRIIKRLRNELEENKIIASDSVSSFLIECLLWNVGNVSFNLSSNYKIIREILAYCFNNTLSDDRCANWVEVSQMKLLFTDTQPWTRSQAHLFLSKAWDYIGFPE